MGPMWRLQPRRKFRQDIQTMDSLIDPIVDRTLRLNSSDLKANENQSFVHALAATGIRDRKFMRDQITAVLLAGRDTTAGTLSFLFYELSHRPEVVSRLRQEVLNTLGPNKAPTYDDLKNMKYLQHCLNETMRLYPSVPFNVNTPFLPLSVIFALY